ncbi:MAG: SusD/RagB family nutrient-binding outer membrane lipoprotein, partial [Muribaculaceae bacterium]|nr:SusD/RagB family nutrient-binding outer membrane lipoprotein [Muribaculaceae bacterium]
SYVDANLARQNAEKAVSSAYGLVETRDDRMEISHSLFNYSHPYVEVMSWNEAKPAASIIAYMNGYEDPRRSVYFTTGRDGEYLGVRVGLNTSNVSAYRTNNLSDLNVNASTPVVLMWAAESYFLRAEGAIRGWNMGGSAEDFYNAGIKASFDERGADGYASYINSDKTPGAFTDIINGNSYSVTSTVTPKWDDNADFETKLERIITQKWIAGYLEGCEAWSDFRRTGYPRLIPVLSNASGGTINDAVGARRIPFPDQEYIDNAAGVATGVANLGGPDNGGTKVWWDKK